MPAAQSGAFDAVLPAGTGECGRPGGDAADGRAASVVAVLWVAAPGSGAAARRLGGEPQTGQAADAGDGNRGNLPEAQYQPGSSRTRGVSLSIAGPGDCPAESGVVRGHHVYPDGEGVRVSGGGDGL